MFFEGLACWNVEHELETYKENSVAHLCVLFAVGITLSISFIVNFRVGSFEFVINESFGNIDPALYPASILEVLQLMTRVKHCENDEQVL